jgi:hypothetical protein
VSQVATVFKLDTKNFNLGRGVVIAAVLLLPLVVLAAIGQENYWLSLSFAALYGGWPIRAANTGTGCRTWPGTPSSARR